MSSSNMLQNNEHSEESSAIAIELNDSDRKIKQQRSQRLSTSPDKFILIASATQASKHRASLKETRSRREVQIKEQFRLGRMMTTPAKRQNTNSLRSILDGSIRQRRSNAMPKTSKQSARGTANLTVIEQSEPTLLSYRDNNVMQSEMQQEDDDEAFDWKQTRSVSNSEVKIKNQKQLFGTNNATPSIPLNKVKSENIVETRK